MEQTIGSNTKIGCIQKTDQLLTKLTYALVIFFFTIAVVYIAYERFFSMYDIVRISEHRVTQVQCGHKLTGFEITPNGQLQMTVRPLQKDEKLGEYKVEFNKKGEAKNLPNVFFEKRCE